MMQRSKSAMAKLAKNIFVGLFISLNPRTAHKIIAFPNTPNSRVRLELTKKTKELLL